MEKSLMPVLFVGHGSPMNAIEENEFVTGWRNAAASIPKPEAILCISAHWETRGTHVTNMEKPETIHDFGGFPQSLFEVEYQAPGSPWLARETKTEIRKADVGLDSTWGLDHGCWSVLRRMYPGADIPVVQLSLDYSQPARRHYEIGKELPGLREKGVLVVGSGNIVHNLRLIDWQKADESEFGYDWALEANEKIKKLINENDHDSLINYRSLGRAFDLSVPTPEHYLPMLYILALRRVDEKLEFFNDKSVMGSLSMTSFIIG